MTTFEPRVAGSTGSQPDQTKHVNYTLGMVLGEDDFRQEFAYLAGRDQWAARDLLGYGTACGLRVTIETDENGPQVVVTAGSAVSPRGQLIRVKPTQCAYLNEWLALDKNRAWLATLFGNSATASLYVVLSYRECRTDQVPIPGEPCRSEEESIAPSRVADDFRLELTPDPPDQREEDALRDFVTWLSQVVFTDEHERPSTLEYFLKSIRDAASGANTSPPEYMRGFPPNDLRIHNTDAREFLRAAFRVWVTELRPRWLGEGATTGGDLPTADGVLLAELRVPLVKVSETAWEVSDVNAAAVREERRPYLLHLRMLQEWLLNLPRSVASEGGGGGGSNADVANLALGGDVTGTVRATRVDKINGITLSDKRPQVGDLLTTNPSGEWQPLPLLIQGQGVAPPPNVDIPTGQVLTFIRPSISQPGIWRAAPFPTPDLSLEGDVIGSTTTGTTVIKLRGINIADPATSPPQADHVLTFKGGAWTPAALPAASSAVAAANTVVGETTFGQASKVGTATQYARADHSHGTPPLPAMDGEVVGGIGSNSVAKLMGVPLAPVKLGLAAEGAVLTLRNGAWRAEPLPTGGSDKFEESSRAGAGSFEESKPSGDEAAAFRFASDASPAVARGGNFVERSPVGPYSIVAAGIVRGDGGARTPVYNGLTANATGNGRLTVTFKGYETPDEKTFQYIVKAMPVVPADGGLNGLVISFDRFQASSLVLRATDGANPVERTQLEKLEFMIEVSRFELGERTE